MCCFTFVRGEACLAPNFAINWSIHLKAQAGSISHRSRLVKRPIRPRDYSPGGKRPPDVGDFRLYSLAKILPHVLQVDRVSIYPTDGFGIWMDKRPGHYTLYDLCAAIAGNRLFELDHVAGSDV